MTDFSTCLITRGLHAPPKGRLIIEPTPIPLAEISTQGAHGLMGKSPHFSGSLAKDWNSFLKY
jgi:hypothetical protein